MELQIAKNQPELNIGLNDEEEVGTIEPIEYETVNVFDKFREYVYEIEKENYRIRKIVISNELYRMLKQHDKFHKYQTHTHTQEENRPEMLFGIRLEHEHFGVESIADFLIYTDRKVIHSDMLEKTFLEDVDEKQLVDNLEVEELVHEANNRIEDREEP